MPQSGMFLSQKEVEELGYFVTCLLYSLTIPGRRVGPHAIGYLEALETALNGEPHEGRYSKHDAEWPDLSHCGEPDEWPADEVPSP